MEISINYKDGKKMEAIFNGFQIQGDQGKDGGGEATAPEPFDYFMASTVMCAAHYIRSFCEARKISYKGIKVTQTDSKDHENKFKRSIAINISLPDDFPEKYKKALLKAADGCTVKKVILEGPQFNLSID